MRFSHAPGAIHAASARFDGHAHAGVGACPAMSRW